jgi:hypothetical protein
MTGRVREAGAAAPQAPREPLPGSRGNIKMRRQRQFLRASNAARRMARA